MILRTTGEKQKTKNLKSREKNIDRERKEGKEKRE